jgi:hypothetical protein
MPSGEFHDHGVMHARVQTLDLLSKQAVTAQVSTTMRLENAMYKRGVTYVALTLADYMSVRQSIGQSVRRVNNLQTVRRTVR